MNKSIIPTIIALTALVLMAGCRNIGYVKGLDKIKYQTDYSPYASLHDSLRVPPGVYFFYKADSVAPDDFIVLEENGICWSPDKSGIWKMSGDTVKMQFYSLFSGRPNGVIFQEWLYIFWTMTLVSDGVIKPLECSYGTDKDLEWSKLVEDSLLWKYRRIELPVKLYKSKSLYDMRKKKWMWTNSRDYKEWKKQGDHSW